MRRIAKETGRPFFEIEEWPISEIVKWLAHFELEKEEFDRANGKGQVMLSTAEDTPEQRQAALMAVLS